MEGGCPKWRSLLGLPSLASTPLPQCGYHVCPHPLTITTLSFWSAVLFFDFILFLFYKETNFLLPRFVNDFNESGPGKIVFELLLPGGPSW